MSKVTTKYTEIAKAKVSPTRTIVISECSKGGFTIAQQLETTEDGKPISVFLKGAFHIDDLKGLYEFRDALNLVIDQIEEVEKNADDWDEAMKDE